MSQKARQFRNLHAEGCFVMPNAWDAGSTVALASLGFEAIGTSSAALAFTLARPDTPNALTVEEVLSNAREIVASASIPVNADFQSGYADTPEQVHESVKRCVEVGVAGLSIEDASDREGEELFQFEEAVDRVRAACSAVREIDPEVVVTARCEAFLLGVDHPMDEVNRRLIAYAEAGADCLFAPGMRDRHEIAAMVKALEPKAVNVLAVDPSWMSLDSLGDLGVRRISVGSAIARVGWRSTLAAARAIASTGELRDLAAAESFQRLDTLFGAAE